jgi:hypothetical protein
MPSCPYGHGVCDECMAAHVHAHAIRHPEAPPRCPCGQGAPVDVRVDIGRAAHATWHRGLLVHAEATATARAPASPPRDLAVALCEHARRLACPHCGRKFVDFEGCAALRCECGHYLCALCLCGFGSGDEGAAAAHAHVLTCSLNPTDTYYVPLAECRAAWLARAQARMRQTLARLRAAHGEIFVWCVRRAVRARDPELLATRPRDVVVKVRSAEPRREPRAEPWTRRRVARTLMLAWVLLVTTLVYTLAIRVVTQPRRGLPMSAELPMPREWRGE